ncbi:MAG: cell division protein FtsA [Hungatella sp.]|nr:cell division protein FtsA [Hungatella sp.]
MARQVKKTIKAQVQTKTQPRVQIQANDAVFALDIGTRSIIGMVGIVEENKVKIIAIEREEHAERAMIDGQIENIEKVATLAGKVKKRLEDKIRFKLTKVCVAAAGRALRSKRAEFELELPGTQLIDDEIISRLEAGAITKAEEAFDAENEAAEDTRRFYLVGYTVCQYFLDQYMISNLKDHRGRHVKVDLIATFLPSEVVESLYTTMNKIGLEVASLTLEPIAAINAAIPENIRLLNLVLVDIGAGTSDIAACTGGSVTGYTMATVAGDEITETIMKEYLVDFATAESIKAQLDGKQEITFADIMGLEHKISREEILQCIQGTSGFLCKEIANKVVEINGGSPSALFLAGGGSKLAGLKDGLTTALGMDANRVAVAGNYFRSSAFSDEYDLNNPEYATPLGIAISSGLNMINDSFRVTLNNKPAKLFRSGSFTALNLLMMNGYNFRDILGRPGLNLTVTVNGRRKVFYGTSSEPATLLINQKEGKLSEVIHAGDSIDFVPAVQGIPAMACLGDIEGADTCVDITLNGIHASLKTPLKNGDIINILLPKVQRPVKEEREESNLSDTKKEKVVLENEHTDRPWEEEIPTRGIIEPLETTPDSTPFSPSKEEAFEEESSELMEESDTDILEESEVDISGDTLEISKADETPNNLQEFKSDNFTDASEESEEEISKGEKVSFRLNGTFLDLPKKEEGRPYYLMDLIQYSGINLERPRGVVKLTVNGIPGMFQQALSDGDEIRIEEEKR